MCTHNYSPFCLRMREREREVEDGGELETLVNCRVFLREEESVLEKFLYAKIHFGEED